MPKKPVDKFEKLTILYRGGDLVAVDKPAGLAVIPGRGETTSVLEVLAAQLGVPCKGTEDPRVRVVHRLDKETSGVLLFALSVEAQRHLSNQFQNNLVEKEYLALVRGKAGGEAGTIDGAIAPHPQHKDRMLVTKHGRPALTTWKVEKRFRKHTLLRCFPKTGKTHQIRVHLVSIGHPLLIDDLYNQASEPVYLSRFKRDYRFNAFEDERPLMARLTLHAEKLRFEAPGGERVEVVAPLPRDFRALITQLGKLG
jgi:23S rRNA pseudouridine955/2504/2580 synthase/23S rRNA pseudouridine1911/1915/1917 synthase